MEESSRVRSAKAITSTSKVIGSALPDGVTDADFWQIIYYIM